MSKNSARMLVLIATLLSAGCSHTGAQSGQSEEMQVYTLELDPQDTANQVSSLSPDANTDQAAVRPQIKPAILLDQSYTIQIGVFDDLTGASSFVSSSQLNAEEAGIATVTLAGQQRFILAYGIYSSAAEAQKVADQFAARMQASLLAIEAPLKIVTLAEIKRISETVNADADILEINSF